MTKSALRFAIEHDFRRFILRWLQSDRLAYSPTKTTQAIDVIQGGTKANALPETVSALGNYRIKPDSSISELESHVLVSDTVIFDSYQTEKNISIYSLLVAIRF